jgi:hypothetical protein
MKELFPQLLMYLKEEKKENKEEGTVISMMNLMINAIDGNRGNQDYLNQ